MDLIKSVKPVGKISEPVEKEEYVREVEYERDRQSSLSFIEEFSLWVKRAKENETRKNVLSLKASLMKLDVDLARFYPNSYSKFWKRMIHSLIVDVSDWAELVEYEEEIKRGWFARKMFVSTKKDIWKRLEQVIEYLKKLKEEGE